MAPTFNPNTMEAFSSNGDGTLTVIKEESPTKFVVEQNVQTMRGAKTLTLDSKTNHVLMIAAETAPAAAASARRSGRRSKGRPRARRCDGARFVYDCGCRRQVM